MKLNIALFTTPLSWMTRWTTTANHMLMSCCALALILGSTSCQETELSPAFVTIDAVSVSTDVGNEGSNTSNVKTVWVFLDGLDLGVFNLPTTFPILAVGQDINLQVRPGIANNGVTDDSAVYPFYTGASYNLNLESFTTTSLSPNVGYLNTTIFRFIDDFESGSLFNETDNSPAEWTLTSDSEQVLDGERSAYIKLNPAENAFDVTSLSFYTLPTDLTPVYLEIDYRCTASFEVGITGINSNFQGQYQPVIFVGAKEEWNKVYINYTEVITQLYSNGFTQFQMVLSGNLPSGASSAEYYFDNIKLVYR